MKKKLIGLFFILNKALFIEDLLLMVAGCDGIGMRGIGEDKRGGTECAVVVVVVVDVVCVVVVVIHNGNKTDK
jgi:hypothetical protein